MAKLGMKQKGSSAAIAANGASTKTSSSAASSERASEPQQGPRAENAAASPRAIVPRTTLAKSPQFSQVAAIMPMIFAATWNGDCAMRLRFLLGWLALAAVIARQSALGDEPDAKKLEIAYGPEIRPLLTADCQKCHSGDHIEAEIDLSSFAAWADVRKHPQVWQKVGQMLESSQMPPKDARQPTDAERARLQEWVHGYLTMEAGYKAVPAIRAKSFCGG